MKNKIIGLISVIMIIFALLPDTSVNAQTLTPTPSIPYEFDIEQTDIESLPGGYWFETIAKNVYFQASTGTISGGDSQNRVIDFEVTPISVCGTAENFVGYSLFVNFISGNYSHHFAFSDTSLPAWTNYHQSSMLNNYIVTRVYDNDWNYLAGQDAQWQTKLVDALSQDMPSYYSGKGRDNWYFNSGTKTDITDSQFTYYIIRDYNESLAGDINNLNLQFICKGTKPSLGGGLVNFISDGDMEQQPVSSAWAMSYHGGRTGNGRIDTNSGGNAEYYGDAHCEDGIQAIGNFSSTIPGVKTGNFADIIQNFTTTENGKIYARAYIKSLGAAATAKLTITSLSTGTVYTLYHDLLGPVWNAVGGSTPSLAAGNYQIKISLDSSSPDPRILVDDVKVSDGAMPIPFYCPSALPTPTPTPNVTGTPLGNYQAIFNCGFSYGDEAWNMTTKYQSHDPYIVDTSYVVYGGDNNYAFVENYYNASISQPFWWPASAMAYLKFDVGSGGLQFPNYTVTIKNSSTNQVVYSKNDPSVLNFDEFAEIRDTVYLPNGLYDIKLTFGGTNSPATFDNITLGRNGYYICPVDPVATATAQPTHDPSTPTPIRTFTAVPTRTQQPTSTVATGQPTSTPIPSFTPPSTQTPWPTPTKTPTPGAATRTPGPAPTYTQYPTYTSQPPLPTHTPQPSYTPNSQGTIEPSITPTGTLEIPSPQPPPNYYAPCDRPQTYDPIAFAQYEQCTLLSFFMWSPRAGATLSAMGTLVVGKEPFGTIEEFSQTNKDLMGYVNSYDWGDTGMPGTGDSPDPNIFLQPGADNPWFSGHIDFTAPEDMPVPDDTCSNRLTTVLGPNISKGYCWMVNFLASKGITPWMQLLIDIGALAFLGAYIVKKWIDAGSVA